MLQIYRVSAITRYLRELLETDVFLADLWVAGEVSNCSRAPSGHIYFTLKDAESQLRCVLWRDKAARLSYLPQNGAAVVVHGYISVYEVQGTYQLYVDTVQPEGLGVLYQQFEALKQKLQAEGLFEAARKRPLPRFPRRIGVVTSPIGAVFHDILNVLRRRYPLAEVILAPTPVQGEGAPEGIVAALQALNDLGDVDVIIVARGGGSLEELWAFNDEGVARAIAASGLPVISGVGHETDFTIADFVADVRAPTPSAAAELVAPDVAALRQQIAAQRSRLAELTQGRLTAARARLAQETRVLGRYSPRAMVDRQRQRLDDLARVLSSHLAHNLVVQRERLASRSRQLVALGPFATLERGYAIVTHQASGRIVARVAQVTTGDALAVRVSDGSFGAAVTDGRPPAPAPNRQPPRASRRSPPGTQLSMGLPEA
jgi:exodeoxyribonuclease VII large subunit